MEQDQYRSKYYKPASAQTLFDRFLQRQTHSPTDAQVQKWEDEGGCIPPLESEALQAHDNDSFSHKINLYFTRAWRAITSNKDSLQNKEKL